MLVNHTMNSRQSSTDSYPQFLNVLTLHIAGVNMIKRQLGKRATPIQEITKTGDDQLTIKTSTGSIGMTTVLEFKLGTPFEETTMDGRKVQVSFPV